MGTHNCLLRLGDALYLEVISINPYAKDPERPRWFRLDRKRANSAPRLAAWVIRTNDIRAAAAASPVPLGSIEQMSRGPLRWQITIRANGGLPFDGIIPSLIEWNAQNHPAANLENVGCSLVGLEGFHPETRKIAGMLESIGFSGPFTAFPISSKESPYLVAHIRTPDGVRRLRIP